MRNFFRNWNLKKHFAVVVPFYTVLLAAANAVMFVLHCLDSEKEIEEGGKWLKYISPEEQKKAVAKSYVSEPSKNVKLVNGIIGACFAADLASYPIIKRLSKKL